MFRQLFTPRSTRRTGERLYAGLVAQARRPEFYTALGVADRIDARFELYTLHVALLLRRLKGEGDTAADAAQAMFDQFVGALDDSLRELGVGDLSVGKRMRQLGEAVFGRMRAYDQLLEPAEPDTAELAGLIARTVFNDEAAAERAAPLADYVLRARAALAARPVEAVIEAGAPWPEPLA